MDFENTLAALLLGVAWASWHLPMFFIPGSQQCAESFATAFPAYVLVVTSWSVVMAVLYSRSGGSLLPCMLFHASLSVAGFSIQLPPCSDFIPLRARRSGRRHGSVAPAPVLRVGSLGGGSGATLDRLTDS